MIVYAMVQELATGLTYRNLRRHIDGETRGDPALTTLLGYLGVDEQAHYSFFLKTTQLFLKYDRAGTLKQLRQVLRAFAMPAIYEMAAGPQRIAPFHAMQLFDDQIFYEQVYQPILAALGVTRVELRRAA